jgi:hypothetical protein
MKFNLDEKLRPFHSQMHTFAIIFIIYLPQLCCFPSLIDLLINFVLYLSLVGD